VRLGAVEVGIGAPADGVVLDAPVGDLAVHSGKDPLLGLADLGGDGLAADDVERPPGQQGRDGIEDGAVGVAADARRLEGDAAAAAEGVPHPRGVPKALFAKLGDQLREACGIGAQVGVDRGPGR
jgi:hypothetical protein